jgi:hypothetical protein
MRTCIFCAKPADSEEHPIALWLIERMQVGNQPIRVGKRTALEINARPPHSLKSLSVRKVCSSCNSGWMGDLEAWFQGAGGLLVGPIWPQLADIIISMLQGDQFAKWALKTAIMLDQAGMIAPVISESFAQDLFEGTITGGITVDLAFIDSTEVAVIFSDGFWTYNGPGGRAWQKHSGGMGFKFVLQLNHLAIRVFCTPEARPLYVAKPDNQDQRPVRCFPDRSDPFGTNYRYRSVFEFDDSFEVQVNPPWD